MKLYSFILFLTFTISCSSDNTTNEATADDDPTEEVPNEEETEEISFYYGADLSYVNEMEDCGATYYNKEGVAKDPYSIFKNAGANLIRVRLWHSPTWTNYSNLEDVKKTIQRAKDKGMKILLDFHYSDTWADPETQEIPAAWEDFIDKTPTLRSLLYDYTYHTLEELEQENLLPDLVQVGNEINGMILQKGDLEWPIDWERNSSLINAGISAVRDIAQEKNKSIEIMLHIAQPENALWWFDQATKNGVTDFDWIGLSYYPIWSDYDLNNVSSAFETLINTYNKQLMVVETAYPFSMEDTDSANNILGSDALIEGYPASEQGQLEYLNALKNKIEMAGGSGLIYWEPAWVSTNCDTKWGTGSHWDNATLFNHENKVTLGMQFYQSSKNN
ncbi:glycosyl hydrolase 53 family protein [Zunongwangia sp. SCSIO 43204]|uniref:glycoside hydrolase family 53 protein n=1 Tax=Zunongwangia sp. SCSIO 43204 TaxID=2779359 RepID=UPI001CA7F3DC|nr:glycosyl hydrolase 53 family protein [Zunongwangia sp. SCSIO 43204]UAB85017.1 glycosyl hydrolase 53 family protein [Zunongwangia sp. SCSIO 43204]